MPAIERGKIVPEVPLRLSKQVVLNRREVSTDLKEDILLRCIFAIF